MKKFTYKIALLMPIVGFTIGLNLHLDPAHLFQGARYEIGIAEIQLAGRNVANVANYDDRLVQKVYIEGLNISKDILVLGSSRSMVIHSDLFPERTMFNHSVSGASLEDHIAIYELYHMKALRPMTILISLDPWLLNRNNLQMNWISLKPAFEASIRRLGLVMDEPTYQFISPSWNKFQQLISPAYFQESLRIWQITLKGNESVPGEYYATDQSVANIPIRLSDGSLSYPINDRVQPPVIKILNTTVNLKEFTILDQKLKLILESWLGSLHSEKIQIVFWLSPYHPEAYEYLVNSPEYHLVVDVQDYYESLAKAIGAEIIGSYDPAEIPCRAEEFFDEQHPKESCIEKIWAEYGQ